MYLNSQRLKMNQNKQKRSNASPEPATAIHGHYFLIMATIRQVLTILTFQR